MNKPDLTPSAMIQNFYAVKIAKIIGKFLNDQKKLINALKEVVQIEYDQEPESRNIHDKDLDNYLALIKKIENKH